MASLGLNATSDPPILKLHDIENSLSALIATIFWISELISLL
jgi:hypothetical protein